MFSAITWGKRLGFTQPWGTDDSRFAPAPNWLGNCITLRTNWQTIFCAGWVDGLTGLFRWFLGLGWPRPGAREQLTLCTCCLNMACQLSCLAVPEWRNWYTHQAQNLARFTPHVGSSPTFGTKQSLIPRFESKPSPQTISHD